MSYQPIENKVSNDTLPVCPQGYSGYISLDLFVNRKKIDEFPHKRKTDEKKIETTIKMRIDKKDAALELLNKLESNRNFE